MNNETAKKYCQTCKRLSFTSTRRAKNVVIASAPNRGPYRILVFDFLCVFCAFGLVVSYIVT